MDRNDRLYTKKPDGTISRWYVFGGMGHDLRSHPCATQNYAITSDIITWTK